MRERYEVASLTHGTACIVPPTPWRMRAKKRLILFFGRRALCLLNRHICAYGPYKTPVICLRCGTGWEEMPKGSVWKGRR